MERRAFLRASAATAGALVVSRYPSSWLLEGKKATDPFAHGVAAGDPTSSSLVIWTRVTPSDDATPGTGLGRSTKVAWQVARDKRFKKIVSSGELSTNPDRDHTVKIDVAGLKPSADHFYRFKALNELSDIGHARTAANGKQDGSLRFGLASCSNYEGGYFSAYRYLAERDDLEFVLHMGDYIYEYGVGGYGPGPEIGRSHEPAHEIVSLADYRMRHALYKRDPDLQGMHAKHAFVSAWDDHEVTNDTWAEGAENHQPDEGDFFKRRKAAYQAYFEWMPIRLPRAKRNPSRIYRRLSLGPLADLSMLDTRQYRSQQPSNGTDPAKDDPARTLTGEKQMKWLQNGFKRSKSAWRLVGNQVMITPWENGEGVPLIVDSWDGYRADRDRLLTFVSEKGIDNVVFLTGDIHTSWAAEVPLDSTTYPATPAAAVEMVGPSVTSDNLDEIAGSPPRTTSIALENGIKADNPYVKFVELDSHGYTVVDVSSERLHVDWFYISDREDPDATQSFATAYETAAGTNTVSEAEGPL